MKIFFLPLMRNSRQSCGSVLCFQHFVPILVLRCEPFHIGISVIRKNIPKSVNSFNSALIIIHAKHNFGQI